MTTQQAPLEPVWFGPAGTPPEPKKPWFRRKKYMAGGVLVALLALGGGCGADEDSDTQQVANFTAPSSVTAPKVDVAKQEAAAAAKLAQEREARIAAEREAARAAAELEAVRVATAKEAARVAAAQKAAQEAAAREAARVEAQRAAAEAAPVAAAAAPAGGGGYYENCTAARAAGVTPLRTGDAGYGSHLDRDGDGVACE